MYLTALNILIHFNYLKSELVIDCIFTDFTIFIINQKIILNFFRLLKDGKKKRLNILERKIKRKKNMKEQRNRRRRKLLLRKRKTAKLLWKNGNPK